MKTLFHILILCLIGTTSLKGQSLSKEYVDNWIEKTFPASKVDSSALYILNGHLIEADSINAILKPYSQSDLIQIDFLDKGVKDSLIFCKPLNGIVLLTTKGSQSKKLIRKYLAEVKGKYTSYKSNVKPNESSQDVLPVLVINGSHIEISKSFTVVERLKASEVFGINIIERPVSQELYGENGKNGLIIISTK